MLPANCHVDMLVGRRSSSCQQRNTNVIEIGHGGVEGGGAGERDYLSPHPLVGRGQGEDPGADHHH